MNAPLKAVAGSEKPGATLAVTMREIGREARLAARALALARLRKRTGRWRQWLRPSALARRHPRRQCGGSCRGEIGRRNSAFLDRLSLDAERVDAMAAGLDVIRKLRDPVDTVMASWRRPNGMRIERVRVPLGVVGMIYESRPNVTADAGALASRPAMRRSCAAAPRASGHAARSMPRWSRVWSKPDYPPRRSRSSPPATAGGRHDARRPRWRHRRDRAARRQKSCRSGTVRGAGARIRSPRRRLPCLCRRQGQARHGQVDRAQCQDRRTGVCGAARPCWSIAPAPQSSSSRW